MVQCREVPNYPSWSLVLHPSWSHGSEQLDGHVYQKLVNQLPLRNSKIGANHFDDNIVSQPNGPREDLKNHQMGSLLSFHPTPLQSLVKIVMALFDSKDLQPLIAFSSFYFPICQEEWMTSLLIMVVVMRKMRII